MIYGTIGAGERANIHQMPCTWRPIMNKLHMNQINLLDEPEYFGEIALDPDRIKISLNGMSPLNYRRSLGLVAHHRY